MTFEEWWGDGTFGADVTEGGARAIALRAWGEVENRVAELERAIRLHRDQRGDDRCWLDDVELYSRLPEPYRAPPKDSTVELENCRRYIASRHDPAVQYVSPQRRIEELEGTLRAALAEAHADPEDVTNRRRLLVIHALARRALGEG